MRKLSTQNANLGEGSNLGKQRYSFKQIASVLFLFLFLYNPIHRDSLLSFGIIPVIFGYFILWRNKGIAHKILLLQYSKDIVSLLLLGAIFSLLSTLIMDGGDLYLPLLMAKLIFIYYPTTIGLIFYSCYNNGENCFIQIIRLLFITILIQSFVVIFQFLFPAFNLWSNSFFFSNLGENVGLELHEFKFPGFSNAGGAGLSLMQGFGVFLGNYCAIVEKSTTKKLCYRLGLVLLVLSATLVGRSGVVVGVCGILLSLIYVRSLKELLVNILRLCVIFAGVLFLLDILFQDKVDFYADVITDYAFEPIINLFKHGKLSSSSTDDLLTMLYIPDVLYVIFGVGAFDVPGYGLIQSDSGYLKTLLASGIFGLTLIYSSFLLMFDFILRIADKSAHLIFFAAFGTLLFFEIKEPFLYQNAVSRCLWLLFSAALFDHYKTINIREFRSSDK